MKWAYILYLPALASLVWPIALLLFKRRPTSAQVLFGVSLAIDAFTISMLAILFRHRTGMMLVYDYLFCVAALMAAPMYYLAVCALTEPRGVSHRNRHVLIVPIILVALISAGLIWLGRIDYEELCQQEYLGNYSFRPGDAPYNFMLFVSVYLFYSLVAIMSLVLVFLEGHKMRVFADRYNSFYSGSNLGQPTLHTGRITLLTNIFVPLAAGLLFVGMFKPAGAQPILITLSILLSVVQFLRGANAYRLNVDAAQLAMLVRKDMQIEQTVARSKAPRTPVSGRDICRYIESDGYLDPDLAVVDLAMRFRLSVDRVVDLVYKQQGLSVAEYIDTVRIEHVTDLLMNSTTTNLHAELPRVAFQCGFLDVDTLERTFYKVMQMSIRQWFSGGGQRK